jgi:hypothetical protein
MSDPMQLILAMVVGGFLAIAGVFLGAVIAREGTPKP